MTVKNCFYFESVRNVIGCRIPAVRKKTKIIAIEVEYSLACLNAYFGINTFDELNGRLSRFERATWRRRYTSESVIQMWMPTGQFGHVMLERFRLEDECKICATDLAHVSLSPPMLIPHAQCVTIAS